MKNSETNPTEAFELKLTPKQKGKLTKALKSSEFATFSEASLVVIREMCLAFVLADERVDIEAIVAEMDRRTRAAATPSMGYVHDGSFHERLDAITPAAPKRAAAYIEFPLDGTYPAKVQCPRCGTKTSEIKNSVCLLCNDACKPLIAAVREHAAANYELGWDIVVEAMDDADIIQKIGFARTTSGAIKKVGEHVGFHEGARREIMAEVF